jgi:putative nucleotidyltransferase with HDIG domain
MPISAEYLEKKVSDLANLPTLPSVVGHVSRLVEDETSSADDIGEIISKDQVLSAKILRLVNSPVYGFPGRISSITHALVLLGFNVVKGLVLGTSVFDAFSKETRGLWEHSLGCAILSRRLAKALGMQEVEEIMMAGLLHDLGKATLAFVAPEEFKEALKIAENEKVHIAQAERHCFSVDHARIASWIARDWHLPARLSEPLTYHHRPSLAKDAKEATAVVHLADILTRGMGYGAPGDMTMPPLSHEAFQLLKVSYEQIDEVLAQAEAEFSAGADIFGAAG